MSAIEEWIEESPYSRFLGVELKELDEGSAVLRLPFKDENSNPGGVLHGGCAASLGAIGGQVMARQALPDAGPWHTAAVQVNYLSAAIQEAVDAKVRLLRRGKELCFATVEVVSESGKPIAQILTTVHARAGRDPVEPEISPGDHGNGDPGVMGPHLGSIPFIGNRGITAEHMVDSTSRLVMADLPDHNGDSSGGTHEGAVLALLDTTGAMAGWAETGHGPYKASTPTIQAGLLGPVPPGELVAYGRCRQRDGSLLWCEVEVASRDSGRVHSRGTVVYRIVT